MTIDGKEQLGGVSILKIRDYMKKGYGLVPEFLADSFEIETEAASKIIETLKERGYIELVTGPTGYEEWKATDLGRQFIHASASKRLKRRSAEKILEELLARAAEVNHSEEYGLKVSKLVVFGSFLNEEKDTLGDLDIGYELSFKDKTPEGRRIMYEKFESESRRLYPYKDILAHFSWAERKVLLRLKNKSGYISLHSIAGPDQKIIAKNCRVVFEA